MPSYSSVTFISWFQYIKDATSFPMNLTKKEQNIDFDLAWSPFLPKLETWIGSLFVVEKQLPKQASQRVVQFPSSINLRHKLI